jgi:hypothetical protein
VRGVKNVVVEGINYTSFFFVVTNLMCFLFHLNIFMNVLKVCFVSFLIFRNAIEEGKSIFYNIRNFVRFQLST